MTFDEIMILSERVKDVRDAIAKYTLNKEPFQALDKLDDEIMRVANNGAARSAENMRAMNAIQSGLENLRGYTLTRKQA